MKNIIIYGLYSGFTKKNVYFLAGLLLFMMLQVSLLYYENVLGIAVSDLDGKLYVYGGLSGGFSLMKLIRWITLLFFIILVVQQHDDRWSAIDTLLLTRFACRAKWWLARFISLLLLTAVYSSFIVICTYLLCLSFRGNIPFTEYTSIYYPALFRSHLSPAMIETMAVLIFVTGVVSLTTFVQMLTLMFNHQSRAFMALIIVLIILAILYEGGTIPRILSPLFYASTLDIEPNVYRFMNYIAWNVLVIVMNLAAGIVLAVKKDIVLLQKSTLYL